MTGSGPDSEDTRTILEVMDSLRGKIQKLESDLKHERDTYACTKAAMSRQLQGLTDKIEKLELDTINARDYYNCAENRLNKKFEKQEIELEAKRNLCKNIKSQLDEEHRRSWDNKNNLLKYLSSSTCTKT